METTCSAVVIDGRRQRKVELHPAVQHHQVARLRQEPLLELALLHDEHEHLAEVLALLGRALLELRGDRLRLARLALLLLRLEEEGDAELALDGPGLLLGHLLERARAAVRHLLDLVLEARDLLHELAHRQLVLGGGHELRDRSVEDQPEDSRENGEQVGRSRHRGDDAAEVEARVEEHDDARDDAHVGVGAHPALAGAPGPERMVLAPAVEREQEEEEDRVDPEEEPRDGPAPAARAGVTDEPDEGRWREHHEGGDEPLRVLVVPAHEPLGVAALLGGGLLLR
ncbi:MAG: hypothetical protein U0166_20250 [Acidobacteriota bacterium]